MLKLVPKQKYNDNERCLGEIVKGTDINKRVYYVESDSEDEDIDLDEKLNAKNIRKMKGDMTLRDIKQIENCIRNNTQPSEDLKMIYDLVVAERKKKQQGFLKFSGIFQTCPDLDINLSKPFKRSQHIYVSGATGSGKSYWVADYLKLINKRQPDREIFIFSDVEHDEAFDGVIKNMTRITLDDSLIVEPITPEEVKNSICLFDDIDSIANKALKRVVNTLRDSLLKMGRHHNVQVISTAHSITDYKNTRTVINESNLLVLFCRSGSVNGQRRLLQTYVGLDMKTIKEIFRIKTRAVCIHKTAPMFYSWQKGIRLLT